MMGFISLICGFLMIFVSMFIVTEGSLIEDFFRFLLLGFLLDFVYEFQAYISALLIVGIALKYTRDWRILALLGALVFGFVMWVFPRIIP